VSNKKENAKKEPLPFIDPDVLTEFIEAAKQLREKPITGDVLRFDLAERANSSK
jgi:hypothetical protein